MIYSNLIEVFLISIFPISLIKFKIIPAKFRLVVLAWVVIFLVALIIFQDGTSVNLGMRMSNLNIQIGAYLSVTFIVTLFLLGLARYLKMKSAKEWYNDPHFLFLFVPISFAQQFLFQGFVLFKLQQVFPVAIAIVITALIFGYMHTIFPRPVLSMTLGIIAGLLFATLYTMYPNIIIASVTHSILNFSAVYLGFFTFVNSDGSPKKTELRLT